VNIHIEPLGRHIATPEHGCWGDGSQLSRAIEEFLNRLPSEFDELVNCHDARARQVEHHILVSCHCTMKGSLPITQIHDVTAGIGRTELKESFRRSIASQFTPTIRGEVVAQDLSCAVLRWKRRHRLKSVPLNRGTAGERPGAPSAIQCGKTN